jgi:hypothetical protein
VEQDHQRGQGDPTFHRVVSGGDDRVGHVPQHKPAEVVGQSVMEVVGVFFSARTPASSSALSFLGARSRASVSPFLGLITRPRP